MTAPEARFVWSFNWYVSDIPEGGNPYDAYPGDDYVDFVGMDIYDLDPPSLDEASWEARCNGVAGICKLMEFARAHGKRVAVGEWGVASCGTNRAATTRSSYRRCSSCSLRTATSWGSKPTSTM